jgi:hypothetical protein
LRYSGCSTSTTYADYELETAKDGLTQSFRLPQPIADLASDILNEWKGDDVRIKGLGKRNKVRSHAFIARTNSTILEHANALIADGQKAIHFAGTEAREQFKPDAKYGGTEVRV